MGNNINKRNPGMDVIRCMALFLVISVHFFLNNGFYDTTVDCTRMCIMVCMRSLFMICVPLFMVLSGYLQRNKKPEKGYYKKGLKTIWIYLLASVACTVYTIVFLQQELNLWEITKLILRFKGSSYGWYIEMYIGLFMMIPFINIMYNHLQSKKQKQMLIAVFIVLTALPRVVNVYNFEVEGWWKTPGISKDYQQLMPAWWTGIYPLTYYFIGCYLNEYGLKLKKSVNVLLIFLSAGVAAIYNIWRSYGSVFMNGVWSEWGSLFNLAQTVFVFVFFMNLNYEKVPRLLVKLISKLSGLCLGGYLVSWIFDNSFYPILLEHVPMVEKRLEYYVIIVPLVFVCSITLSFVLDCIYKMGCFLVAKGKKFDW